MSRFAVCASVFLFGSYFCGAVLHDHVIIVSSYPPLYRSHRVLHLHGHASLFCRHGRKDACCIYSSDPRFPSYHSCPLVFGFSASTFSNLLPVSIIVFYCSSLAPFQKRVPCLSDSIWHKIALFFVFSPVPPLGSLTPRPGASTRVQTAYIILLVFRSR